MWGTKKIKNERGVILVVALLATGVLLLLACAITYTLSSYFKTLAIVKVKDQTHYTTTACLERMRDYFWRNECSPPDWCGVLGAYEKTAPFTPLPAVDTYQDVTVTFTGSSPFVFPQDAVAADIDRVPQTNFSMFFKDDDDDADYNSDQDMIVMGLCKATSNNGVSNTDSATVSTSAIEASFLYGGEDTYQNQRGLSETKRGTTGESLLNDAKVVNQTI